ncbi:LTA synthase family protein [Luteimonas padinae]|uniref:LTA synthase family protein n=1 Tax=Luteimonas padinae TaxID=1714359 RepID=A0ABV6SYF3_9GAMM|nr:LTA synthase family protein [Luteimonas padinae]
MLFAFATWSLDRASIGVAVDAYRVPATVAANAVPGLLVCLALFVATRRLLLSFLMGFALQALVYEASRIKLRTIETPVALEDMYFLTGIDLAGIRLFWAYVEDPVRLLVLLGAGLALLALVTWREKPWFRNFGPGRLALLALTFAAAASLAQARWPWPRLYQDDVAAPTRFSTMPAILHSGLMADLVDKHLERKTRRFDVDEAALRAAARKLAATPDRDAGPRPLAGTRPDIVVVLSESFFDPRIMRGLDDIEDYIPNVRQWIEAGHGGTMSVPAYGGGTIRTEFEILTGLPYRAFPDIGFPYMALDMRATPTLPGLLLREAGYRTAAIHGNQGSFYNRSAAYGAMGFQKFITAKEFGKAGVRDGLWYSDESMTDLLVAELQSEETPLFAFAISMQNHGPYDANRALHADAWERIRLPDGLGEGAAIELRNLLYHLGSADAQFARLLDVLQRRNRPYLLLFFGDHLPGLHATYPELGFVDGASARSQQPPWVLIRGRGSDTWPAAREIAFPWQLPAELAYEAGIDNAYFDFSRKMGAMMGRDYEKKPDSPSAKALTSAARANLSGGFEARVR